MRNILKNG